MHCCKRHLLRKPFGGGGPPVSCSISQRQSVSFYHQCVSVSGSDQTMRRQPPRRRLSAPPPSSQQVNCFTLSREQMTVYLPTYLPHRLAVVAVEDILEKHHYKMERYSSFPFLRGSSSPQHSKCKVLSPLQQDSLCRTDER